MKKNLFIVISCYFLFSCSKKGDLNFQQGNSNNKVATSIDSAGNNIDFSTTGSATSFSKRLDLNGTDTTIFITGFQGMRQVKILMTNIHSAGTYDFGEHLSKNQYSSLQYWVIFGFVPYAYYKNKDNTGQLIIDSLTNTYIKGTFSDTCWSGTSYVVLRNGSFQGDLVWE
jgi:hypothetical protein